MSVLFALLLAASPASTTTDVPAKKPKLRCEWIHEVGTSRPRRVCEKREQAKKQAPTQPENTQSAGEKDDRDQSVGTDD